MSQITKVLGSKNIRVETVTANREGRTSFHDLLIWRTAKPGLLLNHEEFWLEMPIKYIVLPLICHSKNYI